MQRNCALLDQGYVFDQQSDHALAFPIGCIGVLPQPREVGGKCANTCTVFVAEAKTIILALAFILGLRIAECTQLLIPVSFQRIGDQTIGGIDVKIATPREIGLISRLFDFFVAQAVCLVDASLKLLLNRQCDLERQWGHRVYQQFADGLIDCCARHMLAHRLSGSNALALAHIVGDLPAMAQVIAQRHSSPAYPAHHQPLEQRRAFPGRTLSALGPERLGRFAQPPTIELVLFPGEITRMDVGHDQPLFLWLLANRGVALRRAALAGAAKHKGARVTRIVQHLQGSAVRERRPDEFAFVGSASKPAWEQQLLDSKRLDGRTGRCRAPVRLEEERERFLNALVRIENDPLLGVVDQSHRQR
jgi:hypothetical protein